MYQFLLWNTILSPLLYALDHSRLGDEAMRLKEQGKGSPEKRESSTRDERSNVVDFESIFY
jgi:hypothetical protein